MKRDELIEVVRQAIWEVGAADDLTKLDAAGYTKAVLAAIDEAGLVVVPKVPTEAMIEASRKDEGCGCPCCEQADNYTAMIAASQEEG